VSIAAGLDNSFPLQELPQLSLASLLLKILRGANPELDRHVLCLASAAPVTVLPTCIVPLFAVNQDDTSGYVVLLQILYAFLIRTLHCHFGCFSANPLSSVEVSWSLHCRLCGSNTYNEISSSSEL